MPLPTLDGDNRDENVGKKKNSLPNMSSMPPIEDDLNESSKKEEQGLPSFEETLPEDDFKSLPVEETLYHVEESEKEENEEVYKEIEKVEEPRELPKVEEKVKEENYQTEEDYNPDYEEDVKELHKEKFIDKKNKKIVPFGGKKSKKKIFVKSSDFDDRKNKLAKTKLTQFFIISLTVIMFFVGLKNTFLPSHVYTDEQIRQFAAEGAGQTGFPRERGQSFVENFMKSYLEIDPAKPELIQTLAYYYGVSEEGASNLNNLAPNIQTSNKTKQKILIAPQIYDVKLTADNSAIYKVTTYVSNTDGSATKENRNDGRWLSFAVNVYYDKEKDTLAITPDSPSIIPAYRIEEPANVPNPVSLGDPNLDILPALTPTINGYIEAYAKSSVESHESIIQYIDDKNDISLYDGFGGSLELDGEPSEAIDKVVYDTSEGLYTAILTVKWIDSSALQNDFSLRYTSKYKMEIKSIEDGKYAVQSFAPYTYFAE